MITTIVYGYTVKEATGEDSSPLVVRMPEDARILGVEFGANFPLIFAEVTFDSKPVKRLFSFVETGIPTHERHAKYIGSYEDRRRYRGRWVHVFDLGVEKDEAKADEPEILGIDVASGPDSTAGVPS